MSIKNIVILTGAGISAESGIRTFRDAGGLWEDQPVEKVATPEGFAADPSLVHRFYNARRAALKEVEPNAAHYALAKLEEYFDGIGGGLTLVTQNVDDLHERGGSQNVIHMHGELKKAFCQYCGYRTKWEDGLSSDLPCPTCQNRGGLRPDIVWFGEIPYRMGEIERAIYDADLFVSIGTSGAVYPAAGYVQLARANGVRTLELNLEPTAGSDFFDECRHGKAGDIVPVWVDEIMRAGST